MAITAPFTYISDLAPYIRGNTDSCALWQSVTEGRDSGGAYATASIKVDWDQRWIVMGIIGGIMIPNSAGGFSYKVPLQYPDQPFLYASSYKVSKGLGNGTGPAKPYKYAQIDIEFHSPVYSYEGDDAFLTINSSTGGNFVTVPTSVYTFADGTKTDQGVGVFVPEETITVTRHRCPSINRAAFISVVGQLNNATFFDWNPGCVMVTGIESTCEYTAFGTPMFDVTYLFSCRSINWNYFLHPNGTTGFAIVGDGSGNPPYASTDITACFNY